MKEGRPTDDQIPVLHPATLPDDELLAPPESPPNDAFEAAGFTVQDLSWENLPCRGSRFPFPMASCDSERLWEFRERYDFLDTMEQGETELEQIALARDWVHNQLRHRQWIEGSDLAKWSVDVFEVLDLSASGGIFQCTQYGKVLLACLTAAGWTARHVGIGSNYSETQGAWHHGVTDVWVDQLAKWMALDPQFNTQYEKDGVPLSPFEIGDEFHENNGADVDIIVGPERKNVDSSGMNVVDGCHESSRYLWNLHRWWHTDPFIVPTLNAPQLMLVLAGKRHEGLTWHQGEGDKRSIHVGYEYKYFQFTERKTDVYPDINTCQLVIGPSEKKDAVRIGVRTFCPNFDELLVAIQDKPFRVTKTELDWLVHAGENIPQLAFDWYLHGGENTLQVRTRNKFGHLGKPSSVKAILKKN